MRNQTQEEKSPVACDSERGQRNHGETLVTHGEGVKLCSVSTTPGLKVDNPAIQWAQDPAHVSNHVPGALEHIKWLLQREAA